MKRVALALIAVTGVAHAAPTEADEAFERGRQLLEAQKYSEACVELEKSLALDFQFGTLYNVALCDEKIGKLASALKAYRKVARDDVNPARKQTSTDLAAKLATRVPRLVISLPAKPPGLHVQLDGDLVDDEVGVEIPVDLGPHKIVATAPGLPDQTKSIEVLVEGRLETVELSFTAAEVPAAPGSSRATTGKLVIASGGAVLVTGIVVGIVALRDWHHAQDISGEDVDSANAEVHHVQRLGDFSTVCVVVGVAAAAAGVYLWRSGSGSTTLAPQVGTDSAGAMLFGRF